MAARDLDPRTPIDEPPDSQAWLYARATQLLVPGRGSMTKADLVVAIAEAEALPYRRHLSDKELRAEAKDLGLRGYSKLSKDDLAPLVYAAAGPPGPDVPTSDSNAVSGQPDRSDEEFFPVVHPRYGDTPVKDRVIGYVPRSKHAGVMTGLFLQSERYVDHLLHSRSPSDRDVREALEWTTAGFVIERPVGAQVRDVESLPT